MNTIRIKTKIGQNKIYTLYFINNWATIINDEEELIISNSFLEAGQNHLNACSRVKLDQLEEAAEI